MGLKTRDCGLLCRGHFLANFCLQVFCFREYGMIKINIRAYISL